jgi:hypothetical protein
MIDDIELIRRFREEPFVPSPEVLQDARAQLAAAIFREELGEAVPAASSEEFSLTDSRRPRTRPRRRTAVLVISVAAIVIALVAYVMTPSPAIHGGRVAPGSTQHWRLAG